MSIVIEGIKMPLDYDKVTFMYEYDCAGRLSILAMYENKSYPVYVLPSEWQIIISPKDGKA